MKIFIWLLIFFPAIIYAQDKKGFNSKKRHDTTKTINTSKKLKAKKISGKNKAYQNGYLNNISNNNVKVIDKDNYRFFVNRYNDTVFIKKKLIANARLKYSGKKENSYKYLLKAFSSVLPFKNISDNFYLKEAINDPLDIKHYKLQQHYSGIPVYGKEIMLHKYKNELLLNGNYELINGKINTSSSISKEKVKNVIIKFFKNKDIIFNQKQVNQYNILELKPFKFRKVIYKNERSIIDSFQLAFHVTARPNVMERYEFFVNANTGKIIHYFDHTCDLGAKTAEAKNLNEKKVTLNTYKVDNSYYLLDGSRDMFDKTASSLPGKPVGGIITLNGEYNSYGNDFSFSQLKTSDNQWNNKVAVSAHYNASKTYEYYKSNFNRNSIDGDGGSIISFINVKNSGGKSMDNAFWNGKAVFYGNGDKIFEPLAGALDVAGHEYTHGVIQSTANLQYQNESGAINESFADIFGVMIDRSDWLVGEDVVNSDYYSSNALRSLKDPHNGGSSFSDNGYQPKHTDEQYMGEKDNGGVHINSGIPNYAYYLFATELSKDTAEKVFYRTLSKYLTRSAGFASLRLSVTQAARDLYGDTSRVVNVANYAFDSVGIKIDSTRQQQELLPVNPGKANLLTRDTEEIDNNFTIVNSSPQGNNIIPVSNTKIRSKPSITDDGSEAYFVAQNFDIYKLYLNLNNPVQENISKSTLLDWDNVAISKNGRKLAAVTYKHDTSIHVYHFDKEQWASFKLYNPTFTEGIETGGPVYADALEWDYSGEYLVYDAYNKITNTEGDDIEYWDVGFIKVWNKKENDFGSGKIEKLFSGLPENVSIGNPTFAKNSPQILVYDYFNSNKNLYEIRTINIETFDKGILLQNQTLGYPSYSKEDDKIAYSSISNNNFVVEYINLQENKLQSKGTGHFILNAAEWPVYYAKGERTTNLPDINTNKKEKEVSIYPTFFDDKLNIKINIKHDKVIHLGIYNAKGKKIETLQLKGKREKTIYNINLPNVSKGIYIIKGFGYDFTFTKKVIKK